MRVDLFPQAGRGKESDSKSFARRAGLVVVFLARYRIGVGQPAIEIDVAAALGAERLRGLGCRLATDRARLCLELAWRASLHSTNRNGSENPRRRAATSLHTAAGRRHCCR